MTEEQQLFSTIECCIRDAETRLREAEAWAGVPKDAELELSRLMTCLYGAQTAASQLRKLFVGRAADRPAAAAKTTTRTPVGDTDIDRYYYEADPAAKGGR